jgi:sortase A
MASSAPASPVAEAPAVPGRRSRRRPGWVLRLIGKTLLTAAFILGAYILWLLWGTGFYYDRQQARLHDQFQARIAGEDPRFRPGIVLPGQAYAIVRIPSIGVNEVVIEGTAVEDLKAGPGHYEGTADPWDPDGRVGIAGHRTTYGAPFWDLNKVRPGQRIRLVTEQGTYDYVVRGSRDVLPTAKSVLQQTRKPSLVLTTCTPRFSAAMRLIVFADRVGGPLEAAA